MPESEDVGDRRVGLRAGEICRLPTATKGQVLVMGDDGWEAGEAGIAAKMIDISQDSEYFVSKDAEIEWVEVGTGTYMYRLKGRNETIDKTLRIDIKDLLAEFEKPMLQYSFRLDLSTMGTNDMALAKTYILAGVGRWDSSLIQVVITAGGVLTCLRYYPHHVVELTDYKDEFIDVGFYINVTAMDFYLYVDRYIQLFEKG